MLENTHESQIIIEAVEALSVASELSEITRIVAESARKLTKSDGSTFVLRDGDKCFYADEASISPLWKGLRFPMQACVSGWSMMHRQIVCIKDIYLDDRVPHLAYRPTFVKSLCMVPIRSASPIGAIGNYWSQEYEPTEHEIKLLQTLANCASVAVEKWELTTSIEQRIRERNDAYTKHFELEVALHTLVHDLRNPMCSILAFTDLLQIYMQSHIDSKAAAYFESISRTTNRINKTIGQMLTLYKLSNKEIKKQITDLTIICLEIEEQIRAQDPHRKLEITIDQDMIAFADPLLIRLVLENLFTNAFKFTASKEIAKIRVGRVDDDPSGQVFFVEDNGVGFDQKDINKLFKPLSRLHDSSFSGTGLGLASISQIITAHGGSVRAEGKIDAGASFFFTLPRTIHPERLRI